MGGAGAVLRVLDRPRWSRPTLHSLLLVSRMLLDQNNRLREAGAGAGWPFFVVGSGNRGESELQGKLGKEEKKKGGEPKETGQQGAFWASFCAGLT